MKRILIIFFIGLAFFYGCQYHTVRPNSVTDYKLIPNYDFENWGPSAYQTWFWPGWTTNNTDAISSWEISPDSNAYHGHYALQLTNYFGAAYAETKFPISMHPSFLQAFVKCKIVPLDTVSIHVKLFFRGKEVDSGAWKYGGPINDYKEIHVVLSQHSIQVDTALIEISSWYHVSDFHLAKENDFWVDYLSFQVPK